jgi:hypothetical protein
MQALIAKTFEELGKVTAEANSVFGTLSFSELNWKPSSDKWSIAQCLDHLIVSNSTYYPQFNEIISGNHQNSFYQNIGFISRFFGSYLIKETGPVVGKPMKNPPAFTPSQSDLPPDILLKFETHQNEFAGTIAKLDKADLHKTVLYSPALKVFTYSLRDLLVILAGHEQRHLTQAKSVLVMLQRAESQER